MKGLKLWRRPKVWIPGLLILVIVAAAAAAVRNLNSPAEGTVTTPLDQTNQPVNQQPAFKNYKDAYLSFSYPTAYASRPTTTGGSYLDRIDLVAGHPKNRFAAIALTRENIANDPGVSYRRSHTELYKLVSSPSEVVVFSRLDGMEYTGFLVHGDEVLSISLTSVAPDDLSADYNQIRNSLRWAQ